MFDFFGVANLTTDLVGPLAKGLAMILAPESRVRVISIALDRSARAPWEARNWFPAGPPAADARQPASEPQRHRGWYS